MNVRLGRTADPVAGETPRFADLQIYKPWRNTAVDIIQIGRRLCDYTAEHNTLAALPGQKLEREIRSNHGLRYICVSEIVVLTTIVARNINYRL